MGNSGKCSLSMWVTMCPGWSPWNISVEGGENDFEGASGDLSTLSTRATFLMQVPWEEAPLRFWLQDDVSKGSINHQSGRSEVGSWDGKRSLRKCPGAHATSCCFSGVQSKCVKTLFLGHKPSVCKVPQISYAASDPLEQVWGAGCSVLGKTAKAGITVMVKISLVIISKIPRRAVVSSLNLPA